MSHTCRGRGRLESLKIFKFVTSQDFSSLFPAIPDPDDTWDTVTAEDKAPNFRLVDEPFTLGVGFDVLKSKNEKISLFSLFSGLYRLKSDSNITYRSRFTHPNQPQKENDEKYLRFHFYFKLRFFATSAFIKNLTQLRLILLRKKSAKLRKSA